MTDKYIKSISKEITVNNSYDKEVIGSSESVETTTNYPTVEINATYSDIGINSDIEGLGEDWNNELTKFRYIPDIAQSQDSISLSSSKFLEENVNYSDEVILHFIQGRGYFDQIINSENFSYIASFFRTFNDPIEVSDDVFGEATTDDDQTMLMTKVQQDIFSIDDAYTVSLGKSRFDVASHSEQYSINIGKGLFENKSVIDTVVRHVSRPTQDTTYSSDTASASIEPIMLDTTSNSSIALILKQNYVNSSYFGGDYTGTSYVG